VTGPELLNWRVKIMQLLKMTTLAAGVIGATVIAIGVGTSQRVSAAPFNVLPAESLTVGNPIVEAHYRPMRHKARRGHRVVRSRYIRRHRRGNAAAAAMIGAFGNIVAAAIAADSRRDRVYYGGHAPYYGATYPVYDYTPAYVPAPVYGGSYYYPRRRIIRRAYVRPGRVFVPRRAALGFRTPRIAHGAQFGRPWRAVHGGNRAVFRARAGGFRGASGGFGRGR
jgi:hypothetical protein